MLIILFLVYLRHRIIKNNSYNSGLFVYYFLSLKYNYYNYLLHFINKSHCKKKKTLMYQNNLFIYLKLNELPVVVANASE